VKNMTEEHSDYFLAQVADLMGAKETPISAEERQRRRMREKRVAREERFSSSGLMGPVPADVVEALITGEKLVKSRALEAVVHWRQMRHKATRPFAVMVLVGDTGVGKTVAAAWLLLELGGMYVTAEEMRKRATSKHRDDRTWFEKVLGSKVLVVDDVGTERDLEDARVALYEVVNARQGLHRGWTLILGNLAREVFRERYGKRTCRRIEDQGVFIEIEDVDRRRKEQENEEPGS
jgi:DNA replication protein DnaC